MSAARRRRLPAARAALLLLAAALLAACAAPVRHAPTLPPAAPLPPPPPPAAIAATPDAQPRAEPRSAHGNPPFYDVLGQRYFVLATADGYLERGVASWYGPSFHGGNTSSGESYDMYGMTAAHKTLPLPSYARVTNLANGRSVEVVINDRGPAIAGRLIDLSAGAATVLGMRAQGLARVAVMPLAE